MASIRILLMYISEVSGHHSATLAIEKALKIIYPDTEVLNINAFHYTNPISEKIVNRIYMGMIKNAPQIWDYLYDNPTVVKRIEKIKNIIHKVNSAKLKVLFDRFKPDVIACTQAFPCGMVADFKKTYNSKIPLVAVLTDYIPHSYWIYETIDYYITPSEGVTATLVEKGVDVNKIKSLGIPINPKFNQAIDKNEIMRCLNLKPDLPVVLIMGGGHGLGPIKTIVNSLEKVNKPMQEIIVVGSNKKLYNSLKEKIKKYKKNILFLGYVENIDELMGISEIIITKPGGITTAEALAKKLPMVIVKPIPGQEISNALYLIKEGAAVKAEKPKKINFIIEDFLGNPDKLRVFSQSAARISKPNASLDIANFLIGLANV